MIEMIIVCVIMALLMSTIVYRMTSRQGRSFDATIDREGFFSATQRVNTDCLKDR